MRITYMDGQSACTITGTVEECMSTIDAADDLRVCNVYFNEAEKRELADRGEFETFDGYPVHVEEDVRANAQQRGDVLVTNANGSGDSPLPLPTMNWDRGNEPETNSVDELFASQLRPSLQERLAAEAPLPST